MKKCSPCQKKPKTASAMIYLHYHSQYKYVIGVIKPYIVYRHKTSLEIRITIQSRDGIGVVPCSEIRTNRFSPLQFATLGNTLYTVAIYISAIQTDIKRPKYFFCCCKSRGYIEIPNWKYMWYYYNMVYNISPKTLIIRCVIMIKNTKIIIRIFRIGTLSIWFVIICNNFTFIRVIFNKIINSEFIFIFLVTSFYILTIFVS